MQRVHGYLVIMWKVRCLMVSHFKLSVTDHEGTSAVKSLQILGSMFGICTS